MKKCSCQIIGVAVLTTSILAVCVKADSTWDGGAGASDPAWSTGANWVGDSSPSTSAGGIITFDNTALGATNLVDQNWTIGSLIYNNTTVGSAHTTIVANASTLLINGSTLNVGYKRNNTLVVIKGPGTLQLGDATHPVDVLVEVGDDGGLYTGSSLVLSAVINAANLNNFFVGRQTTGGGGATGVADLSGSSISYASTPNKFRLAGTLGIGCGGGRNPIGTLSLPASLTEIAVGTFDMAAGLVDSTGIGTLDLGVGSQLTYFSATNGFYLGNDGLATLLNWPTNVVVKIGTAAVSAPMVVGYSRYRACGGILSLTNGSFTAYLSSLIIGDSTHPNNGTCTGILDLASTTVQIGDVANKIKVPVLHIGAGSGAYPFGVLRLPSAITEIAVDTFDLGYSWSSGYGMLDLGVNSQLTSFTASNAFYMGRSAITSLTNWPTNVVVRIGTSSAPAPMIVGLSTYGTGCGGILSLTNGSFTAYLSLLRIGYSTTTGGNGDNTGILDLASTSVQIGDTVNKVRIPELTIGGGGGRNPRGTLKLPSSINEISVGIFDVGSGSVDGGANGTLDLGLNSQLASFTASNAFYLANAGSSTVIGWPSNVVVSIGTVNAPAPMVLGLSGYSANCNGSLALTNGSFSGHLSYLKTGINTHGSGNGSAIGILDLRQTTLSALTVSGDVSIGYEPSLMNWWAHGYVYLPQGSVVIGGNLYIGDTTVNWSGTGLLELNNTRVTVSNSVAIDTTGALTNFVNGLSSGIDLQTTNLSITAAGGMYVQFQADPQNNPGDYWGLSMKGDAIAQISALTTTPAKVTYNISALSAKNQQKFGVFYNEKTDRTILGILAVSQGTVFSIR